MNVVLVQNNSLTFRNYSMYVEIQWKWYSWWLIFARCRKLFEIDQMCEALMNIWEFNVDIGLKHGCVHEMSICLRWRHFRTKDVLIMITLVLTWDRSAIQRWQERKQWAMLQSTDIVNRRVNQFNYRYKN